MDIKTQRYLSLGLAALNVAGTIGMFVSLTKEAPKAQIQLNLLPKDAKKSTKVKTFIKNYKVSLIFAGATIASGVASKVLSTKTEASLIATVGMLDASLHKYKGKIKETLGVDANKDIIREIIKETNDAPDGEALPGEELFKCELIGYFYAKPENVWKAMTRINEDISGEIDYCSSGMDYPANYTLAEFIKLSKARPLVHTLDDTKLEFGWSYEYLSECHNTVKIHWDVDEYPDDDGARLISFLEEPVWLPDSWSMHKTGQISDEDYFRGSDPKLVNPNDSLYSVNK
jgi:hypothetical protein